MKLRVGYGYDVHQLKEGYDLFIGGVKFDSEKGAVGHSDADVLLHAISDALLGAANLRDIGYHFPDTDSKYKGADSKKLLSEVNRLISNKGYKISNIDSTVVLEKPKVNPRLNEIVDVISGILQIDTDDVSIKATTSEKMGFVGAGNGISAHSVALIYKEK